MFPTAEEPDTSPILGMQGGAMSPLGGQLHISAMLPPPFLWQNKAAAIPPTNCWDLHSNTEDMCLHGKEGRYIPISPNES